MDVSYFLSERLSFIAYYFDTSSAAFLGEIEAIENGLPPYDDPPWSDDPEPAYLTEWLRADAALNALGRSCISMLAKLVTQYFDHLFKRQIGITFDTEEFKKQVKKSGIAPFYRDALLEIHPSLAAAGIDFDLIEEVVLIRNRDQHADEFLGQGVRQDQKTMRKMREPRFVSMHDLVAFQETNSEWFLPHVTVSRESLEQAMDELRKLAAWLDAHEHERHAWRSREFSKRR